MVDLLHSKNGHRGHWAISAVSKAIISSSLVGTTTAWGRSPG